MKIKHYIWPIWQKSSSVVVTLVIMLCFPSDTHCCCCGGLPGDCSTLPSRHRCRPGRRRAGGCPRCPGRGSEVRAPSGSRGPGPAGPSAGSAAWWRTGLRWSGDPPGPVLSGPLSRTARSSLWTGSETPWAGPPRCLAVEVREQEAIFRVYRWVLLRNSQTKRSKLRRLTESKSTPQQPKSPRRYIYLSKSTAVGQEEEPGWFLCYLQARVL